jgi:hypothetical protein
LIVELIDSLNTHAGVGDGAGALPADWLKVMRRPAAVNVPVRAAPLFASAVKLNVPFPLPAAPDVMCNQSALLTAFHAQPVDGVVVTPTENVPPAGYPLMVSLIESEYAHDGVGAVETGDGDELWPHADARTAKSAAAANLRTIKNLLIRTRRSRRKRPATCAQQYVRRYGR